MVAVITSLATFPPSVAALGAGGAGVAMTATVTGVAAIEGVSVGATVLGVGEGAIFGVGALFGGSSAGMALATLAGPIGSLIVGCSYGTTWDCWKPVVRDMSTEPSSGISLRSLASHPNVQSVSVSQDGFLVENVFGESFCLTCVSVDGTLALHASMIPS
ncbi:hypothetical protein TWF481_007596 [Arthrobotrys musiformis]|uniref:Secreted protein n=1 Tax=Arthrobotrys musiformis TaxID=47236 RepID=A0AAV9WCT0_9PEZI